MWYTFFVAILSIILHLTKATAVFMFAQIKKVASSSGQCPKRTIIFPISIKLDTNLKYGIKYYTTFHYFVLCRKFRKLKGDRPYRAVTQHVVKIAVGETYRDRLLFSKLLREVLQHRKMQLKNNTFLRHRKNVDEK